MMTAATKTPVLVVVCGDALVRKDDADSGDTDGDGDILALMLLRSIGQAMYKGKLIDGVFERPPDWKQGAVRVRLRSCTLAQKCAVLATAATSLYEDQCSDAMNACSDRMRATTPSVPATVDVGGTAGTPTKPRGKPPVDNAAVDDSCSDASSSSMEFMAGLGAQTTKSRTKAKPEKSQDKGVRRKSQLAKTEGTVKKGKGSSPAKMQGGRGAAGASGSGKTRQAFQQCQLVQPHATMT